MGRPAKKRQSKVYPASGETPLDRVTENLKRDPGTAKRIERGKGAIEVRKKNSVAMSAIVEAEATVKSQAREKAAAKRAKTLAGERQRLQRAADKMAVRQERIAREIARTTGAVVNPIEAVVRGGLNPDVVLAPVDQKTSGAKTATPPIEYLTFRCTAEHALVADQYRAAKTYEGMFESLRAVASNTAATIKRLSESEPWTQADIEAMHSGEMMKPFHDDKIPNTEWTAGEITSRIQRIRSRLDRLDVAILDDLLLRQLTVGVIAGRWNFSPEQMSALIKVALWRLVTVMESVDAEFRAEAIARRTLEQQMRA